MSGHYVLRPAAYGAKSLRPSGLKFGASQSIYIVNTQDYTAEQMVCSYEHQGTTFVWNDEKAAENELKHDVRFEEATTVFDDPLFIIQDASRNNESRDVVIGFSSIGRLLMVVHVEAEGEFIRIISAWRATAAEEALYDQ